MSIPGSSSGGYGDRGAYAHDGGPNAIRPRQTTGNRPLAPNGPLDAMHPAPTAQQTADANFQHSLDNQRANENFTAGRFAQLRAGGADEATAGRQTYADAHLAAANRDSGNLYQNQQLAGDANARANQQSTAQAGVAGSQVDLNHANAGLNQERANDLAGTRTNRNALTDAQAGNLQSQADERTQMVPNKQAALDAQTHHTDVMTSDQVRQLQAQVESGKASAAQHEQLLKHYKEQVTRLEGIAKLQISQDKNQLTGDTTTPPPAPTAPAPAAAAPTPAAATAPPATTSGAMANMFPNTTLQPQAAAPATPQPAQPAQLAQPGNPTPAQPTALNAMQPSAAPPSMQNSSFDAMGSQNPGGWFQAGRQPQSAQDRWLASQPAQPAQAQAALAAAPQPSPVSQAAPVANAQANPTIPHVMGIDDYAKLPRGAQFTGPDGQTRIKS